MRRLNAYFVMSTANPTGQRPWNFAMQPGNLGFYVKDNYPLPQRSLGRLGEMPTLTLSRLDGKNAYGLSRPIYTPLSRNFLGTMFVPSGASVDQQYLTAPVNTLRRWFNPAGQPQPLPVSTTVPAPTPTVTAAGTPIDSSPATVAPTLTSITSWFTDPSQEIFSGIPNWGIVGAGALAAMMLFGGKRRW